MKKFTAILMICFALVAFAGCGNSEVKDALEGTRWFCNAGYVDSGEDSDVTRFYEFIDGDVYCNEVVVGTYVDSSIIEEAAVGSFSADDSTITLKFDGKEDIVIPYTLANGEINLEEGVYFSDQDIVEGIQGHWQCREEPGVNLFGDYDDGSEYHIEFNDDYVKTEYATDAADGGPGQYYYYGPRDGEYEIGYFEPTGDLNDYSGGEILWLDGEDHSDDVITYSLGGFFFHIENGEVVLYCDVLSDIIPMEYGGEFPGEYGYKFK